MNTSCSAIVPFHNEKKRIFNVLNELIKIKSFSQIICVDDGSTDGASSLIKKQYPKIVLVCLDRNRGKTTAVTQCLTKVKTDKVFLCDADLHHLKKNDVERALNAVSKNDHIDMMILRRIHSVFQTRVTRGDILFSGERILRKRDLLEILKTKPKKYQLEIAINKYMIDNKKIVRWLPSSALSTFKIYKVGLFMGIINEWKMLHSMFSYAGWHEYWRQVLFFCHEKHFSS